MFFFIKVVENFYILRNYIRSTLGSEIKFLLYNKNLGFLFYVKMKQFLYRNFQALFKY